MSSEEIAELIGSTTETVQRWIRGLLRYEEGALAPTDGPGDVVK
jgi:hypothetical protein